MKETPKQRIKRKQEEFWGQVIRTACALFQAALTFMIFWKLYA